jgi:hypothetical protein
MTTCYIYNISITDQKQLLALSTLAFGIPLNNDKEGTSSLATRDDPVLIAGTNVLWQYINQAELVILIAVPVAVSLNKLSELKL